MLKNRSVALVIILSLVTCGIYGLYWIYVTAEALENNGRAGNGMNGIVLLLLCLFIPSVGYLLFGMAADQNLNSIRSQRGLMRKDNKVVYMLLGFFIPIVLVGLVQNDINEFTPAV